MGGACSCGKHCLRHVQEKWQREGWCAPVGVAMCEVWAARSARAAKRGGSSGGGQGLGLGSSWPDLPPELVALVFAGLRLRDLRRGALPADCTAVAFPTRRVRVGKVCSASLSDGVACLPSPKQVEARSRSGNAE